MRGLSYGALKKIANLIDQHFDSIGLKFLGLIPKSRGSRIFFDAEPDSLVSLFLEALDTKSPTKTEEDTLKSILTIADGYVDALKERTKAQVLQDINAYVNDQKRQKKPIDVSKVNEIFTEKIDKAKAHFELIAGQESYKTKNIASALKFTRIGESLGESDPTVFFVVTHDDRTGPYEYILHTLPDKVTPRLWKLSEVQSSYYKPGDQYPSFSGLHVNCFTETQKLYTKEGLVTFKELFETQQKPTVMVDGRVINKKIPANHLGKEVPGLVRLDPHIKRPARFFETEPIFYTGKQPVLRLHLTSGHEIEVTENHEMWVSTGNAQWGKRMAHTLKVGDKIPLAAYSECFGKDHFPEEAELIGNLFRKDVQKPKKVPERLFKADKETVSAFLRGLCKADEYFESNRIVLYQNDLEFLKQIQLLISMFGFVSKIHHHSKSSMKTITYSDDAKFKNAKISKIEKLGELDTYCLTEPMTNTVTVNGIITGQCRCKLSYLPKGYGFGNDGRIKFIAKDHDEFKVQREKYGLPEVPQKISKKRS